MADAIETIRVQQYFATIRMLWQQTGSRLRSLVRNETLQGKAGYFDQAGTTSMSDVNTRHGDTSDVFSEVELFRRHVTAKRSATSAYVDEDDLDQVLNDPVNSYSRAQAAAAGRKIDELIIAAAFATARTGEDGSGSAAFPAANQIAAGGTGLTLDKLRQANQILDANEVDEDSRVLALSSNQKDDMLAIPQYQSTETNAVAALVRGDTSMYLGFQFTRTELLTLTGTVRSCIAWHPDSMLLAIGREPNGSIDRLPQKHNSFQIYLAMRAGATRMDELGVVQVDCDQA